MEDQHSIMLGLVFEIIPVSVEVRRTGCNVYNSPDQRRKFIDLIFQFLWIISTRKFAQRVTVA